MKRITIHDLAPKAGAKKVRQDDPLPPAKPRGRKWTKHELRPVTILNPGSAGKKKP
jgi:hypothetical protein